MVPWQPAWAEGHGGHVVRTVGPQMVHGTACPAMGRWVLYGVFGIASIFIAAAHIVPQIFGPDFPEVFLLIVASAVLYGLAFAVMPRGY